MKTPIFKLYSRVRLVRCNELTGMMGTVLGRSFTHPAMDSYIVLLDKNQFDGDGVEHSALSITQHCLEQIYDLTVRAVELYIDSSDDVLLPIRPGPVYEEA